MTLLLTLAKTETHSNLEKIYDDAFTEFTRKMREPQGMTAKDRREADSKTSQFIKENFKPEADVLVPADKQWSSFFCESKAKAKEKLREYLADTVSEFVDTNVLSGNEFFNVLLEVVYDNWLFYKKNADENEKLLKLLQNVDND